MIRCFDVLLDSENHNKRIGAKERNDHVFASRDHGRTHYFVDKLQGTIIQATSLIPKVQFTHIPSFLETIRTCLSADTSQTPSSVPFPLYYYSLGFLISPNPHLCYPGLFNSKETISLSFLSSFLLFLLRSSDLEAVVCIPEANLIPVTIVVAGDKVLLAKEDLLQDQTSPQRFTLLNSHNVGDILGVVCPSFSLSFWPSFDSSARALQTRDGDLALKLSFESGDDVDMWAIVVKEKARLIKILNKRFTAINFAPMIVY